MPDSNYPVSSTFQDVHVRAGLYTFLKKNLPPEGMENVFGGNNGNEEKIRKQRKRKKKREREEK